MFDIQMRKVGLQSFGQGFGLVAPHGGGAERMAPGVGPGQRFWIDQDEAADTRLGQRAGDRCPDRTAADHHDRRAEQPARAGILTAPMHPIGIGALHERPDDRSRAEKAAEQQRLWGMAGSESHREGFVGRSRPAVVSLWVERLYPNRCGAPTSNSAEQHQHLVRLAFRRLLQDRPRLARNPPRQMIQIGGRLRVFCRKQWLVEPEERGRSAPPLALR
jgi:hypothetical protein